MKITVIGAGLLGVTTAYFLARDGHEVDVIDRANGPAMETSFANAGMLTPSMADPWNAPGILGTLLSSFFSSHSSFKLRAKAIPSMIGWGLSFLNNSRKPLYLNNLHRSAALACYSMDMLTKLNEELDIHYDGITTGSLKVFRDQKSLDKLAKLSEHLKDHDMTFRVVKGDALLEVETSLAPVAHQLCGGVYFPGDHAGNAYLFTCEMEKEAKKLGVNFHYGIDVKKMIREGSKVNRVITENDELKADKFVLAAGSYSTLIAKSAGLFVPIRPAKGYSLSVPLNGWNGGPRMPLIDDGFHAAISPLGNVLRIAGTAEFAGYDRSLTRERLDNLYHLLDEIYPDFKPFMNPDKVTEWAGLRPLTADGSPFIGQTEIDNLYINAGHGPLGWTMAAGSAKMLADIIATRRPSIDPKPYSLDRY